jgi:hypothetical protein
MADPQKFTPGYSYTNWQSSNPTKPLPGNRVDQDMANLQTSVSQIVDAIKDVRRSDGKLKNGIVTVDSLAPAVKAILGSSTYLSTVSDNIDAIITTADNIASVNTLAAIADDVSLVATIPLSVSTVAGIAADVTTVAGAVANVETAAAFVNSTITYAADAADSAAGALVSEGAAAVSALTARQASEASGAVVFYDTKALANAAVAALPVNQIVEVFNDESQGGARTRYRKEGSALVFKTVAGMDVDDTFLPSADTGLSSPQIIRKVLEQNITTSSIAATGADIRTALQAALNAAGANERKGRREVIIRGGDNYGLSAKVDVPSRVRVVFDGDARLVPTVTGAAGLMIEGARPASYVALTADAAKSSITVQLASTAAFSVGQDVFLRSQTLLPIAGFNLTLEPQKKCGQWCKVVGKTGTLLYLDTPLEYDYLVSASAEIGVGFLKTGVQIENFKWGEQGLAAVGGRGAHAKYVRDFSMFGVVVENTRAIGAADDSSRGGILLEDSIDGVIEDFTLRQIGYYGVSIDGASSRNRIARGFSSRSRHTISLVNGGDFGEPFDTLVDAVVSECSTLSGFDTHEYGDRTIFRNCISRYDTDRGFQVRSRGVLVEGCTAIGSSLDGLAGYDGAADFVVRNFAALDCKRTGMTFNRPVKVDGAVLKRNGKAGTNGRTGLVHRGGEFSNVRIEDTLGYATAFGSNGDIVAGITPARAVFRGLFAPYSAGLQDTLVLAAAEPEFDFRYLIFEDCDIRGYEFPFLKGAGSNQGLVAAPVAPQVSNCRTTDGLAGNETEGYVTLVGGTATIATTAVRKYMGQLFSVSSRPSYISSITINRITAGGAPGALGVGNITDRTSFTITSTSGTDTSVVKWKILN